MKGDTVLFSKDQISDITYSFFRLSQYKVVRDGTLPSIVDTTNNRDMGYFYSMISQLEKESNNVYTYNKNLNKDFIVVLPHIFITYASGTRMRFIFNTDDELNEFLLETGLDKIISSNKFLTNIEDVAKHIQNRNKKLYIA